MKTLLFLIAMGAMGWWVYNHWSAPTGGEPKSVAVENKVEALKQLLTDAQSAKLAEALHSPHLAEIAHSIAASGDINKLLDPNSKELQKLKKDYSSGVDQAMQIGE